jgi:hypothetical protein
MDDILNKFALEYLEERFDEDLIKNAIQFNKHCAKYFDPNNEWAYSADSPFSIYTLLDLLITRRIHQNIKQPVKIRNRYQHKIWSYAIIERDQRCKKCGSRVKLEAHHIKNIHTYPDIAFALDNGITLCERCHHEFHAKYYKSDYGMDEVNEFILPQGV